MTLDQCDLPNETTLQPSVGLIGEEGAVDRIDAHWSNQQVFMYAASCASLEHWSVELGFRVLHFGVSSDPLRSVATLRNHAALTYFSRPFDEDHGACDWNLLPLCFEQCDMPPACERWGGVVKVNLHDASVMDLGKRLALFLGPLDALTCAQVPSALWSRWRNNKFLPVMGRYTEDQAGAARLVADLYRVDGKADEAYVIEALAASLMTLGPERKAFDRVLATLADAPRGRERIRASSPSE